MIASDTIAEVLELRLPAESGAVRAAAAKIGAHLRLRGLDEPAWRALELAIVEGLNNAVTHGCAGAPDEPVIVRVLWHEVQLRLEIRDPGNFTPGPEWGRLPADPLVEHGRGGFLMRQAFARVEHHNDASGHVLVLATDLAQAAGETTAAIEAQAATEELTADLETAYETVTGLRFLVSLLAKSTAHGELVERALARLHEIDGFAFACVRLVQRSYLELDRSCGVVPALAASLSLGDDSAETRAVLTRTTQRITDCDALPSEDPLQGAGGPAVVAPICFEQQRVGTLTVVRSRERAFFNAGTIELVQTVAEFLGVAWATSRLQARERDLEVTAHELSLAARMQARLLPASFPARSDLRFSGTCRSAQTVGGDFYDVFTSAGGTLLVIADAMGKGVPAAFVASVLRCAIRAREHLAADPGALLAAVNRQLSVDLLALDTFVTVLVGFVPAGAAEIRLASAGHCPAFLRRRDGTIDVVHGLGLPVGILTDTSYSSVVVPLEAGDLTVLLTDGVYEIGATAEEQLGLEGMRAVVAGTRGRDADETLQALLKASDAHSGGKPPTDDRTLLVCERLV